MSCGQHSVIRVRLCGHLWVCCPPCRFRHPSVDSEFLDLSTIANPPRSTYSPILAYGASKLCNLLFALEVNRRFGSIGVTCNAIHPGNLLPTHLSRNSSLWYRLLYAFAWPFTKSLVSVCMLVLFACVVTVLKCTPPVLTLIVWLQSDIHFKYGFSLCTYVCMSSCSIQAFRATWVLNIYSTYHVVANTIGWGSYVCIWSGWHVALIPPYAVPCLFYPISCTCCAAGSSSGRRGLCGMPPHGS